MKKHLDNKNNKDVDSEKINKNKIKNEEKNIEVQDKKFMFYDQNIKMIRKNSGISKEKIDQLVDTINRKGSILGYIDMIFDDDSGVYDKKNGALTKELTDKYGLSNENSWVEKLFDDIRGKSKIFKIENCDDMEFRVYMSKNEDCWYNFTINGKFFSIRRIDGDIDIKVNYIFEK